MHDINNLVLCSAFDTIDHGVLLACMQDRLGISSTALHWFKSYLHDRSQIITINGERSNVYKLQHGVPQGSVLGPLLFCIYLLPLGDLLRSLGISYHLYADDLQLYVFTPPNDISNAISHLEHCIKEIKNWFDSNMLKLNSDKTEFIVLGSSQSLAKLSIPSLQVDDTWISHSRRVRNLGVLFDSGLQLDCHVSSLSKSINYHLRNIGMIRQYLTKEAAERAVHALISSRLDYCNSLLFGLPSFQLDRLQRLQNNAARIISRTKKRNHISPVLKTLHWLPVRQRIIYKILVLTFKCIHGLSPIYLQQLVHLKHQTRTLRSNSQLLLHQPLCNSLSLGDRSFSCAAPKLWNTLPSTLRSCCTLNNFKGQLKTHLFKLSY